jgi:hypothetical protein
MAPRLIEADKESVPCHERNQVGVVFVPQRDLQLLASNIASTAA